MAPVIPQHRLPAVFPPEFSYLATSLALLQTHHFNPTALLTHRLRAIASLKVTSHFLPTMLPDYNPSAASDNLSPPEWVITAIRGFLQRLETEVEKLWKLLDVRGNGRDGRWTYDLCGDAELPWYLEPYHMKILMFMADFFENAMGLRVCLGFDHRELKVRMQVPLRFGGEMGSGTEGFEEVR